MKNIICHPLRKQFTKQPTRKEREDLYDWNTIEKYNYEKNSEKQNKNMKLTYVTLPTVPQALFFNNFRKDWAAMIVTEKQHSGYYRQKTIKLLSRLTSPVFFLFNSVTTNQTSNKNK